MKSSFNPALASLVHHVELNKAGWWDEAVKRLILISLWMTGKEANASEISQLLKTEFGITVENGVVEKELRTLDSGGDLILLGDKRYKISQTCQKSLDKEIGESEDLERRVEQLFSDELTKNCHCDNAPDVWNQFKQSFLLPLIKDFGANTYTLVTGGALNSHPERLEQFLDSFSAELRIGLQATAEAVLHPKNRDVSSYILRMLNGFFFLEASSLSAEALAAITSASKKNIEFVLFLDTNFLLGVLGLTQEEDGNSSILELVNNLAGRVSVKLYVLPITMDETQRVLIQKKHALNGMRLTSNLMDAALAVQSDSIERRFLQEYKKRGTLNADDYFKPFLEDLLTVLRSKGIELYNDNLDGISMMPEVVDDINEGLEYEKKQAKPKNYDRLNHDIVLWHFLQGKRPARIESPLEAHFWIVTLDNRLIGFDQYKRKARKAIPVCIHPTNLVQMLQFWIPRNPKFEEAVLNTLRLPFLLQDFDPNAERTTLNIIKALGEIENIGDLDEDTLSEIMVNRALREKLHVTRDQKERLELVRETFIDIHNRKMKEKEDENRQLQEQVEAIKKNKDDLQTEVDTTKDTNAELVATVNDLLQSRERFLFLLRWVIFPFCFAVLVLIGASLGLSIWFGWKFTYVAMVVFWPLFFAVVWVIDNKGGKNTSVLSMKSYTFFHKFKVRAALLIGFLYMLSMNVLGGAIWDAIKRLFNLQ